MAWELVARIVVGGTMMALIIHYGNDVAARLKEFVASLRSDSH